MGESMKGLMQPTQLTINYLFDRAEKYHRDKTVTTATATGTADAARAARRQGPGSSPVARGARAGRSAVVRTRRRLRGRGRR